MDCPCCGETLDSYVWNEDDECFESYDCSNCGAWM